MSYSKNKQKLCFKFDMTDLGPAKNTIILDLQVICNKKNQIFEIIHVRYIQFSLTKFKMKTCNPVSTLIKLGQKITKIDSPQKITKVDSPQTGEYKPLQVP